MRAYVSEIESAYVGDRRLKMCICMTVIPESNERATKG